MKILVTGGAGFIGSHLCELLLNQGHQVICLDNFYTGDKKNIEKFAKNSKFEIFEHDVTEPYYAKADQIYNLACPASPVQYQKHPVKTVTTSVLGAIHALELSKKLGKIPVLQASTSEVYGDPTVHPQSESYHGNVNPIGPRACYDEGKRAAETIFFDYFRQENIPIKVVRIFNTYGPNMALDDGRVISNFIVRALQGKDIVIYGTGHQTRSFCYIQDLAEGMYRMMESSSFTGPVNLGNPEEYAISDLAKIIIEMTQSSSSVISGPLPEDDPKQRQPDISLAKKVLQWKPNTSLREGLKPTIAYFRDRLS